MTAKQRAHRWATLPVFDMETRSEVARYLKDETELIRRFGHELSFGTGGLRGVLGVGTNRMNRYTVAKVSHGLARYVFANDGMRVAIAHDSRHHAREFALVTAGVLAAHGIHASLFAQLMPTPVLSFATRYLQADAGVMITASYNPATYNGYKVYGVDGCQITEEAAAAQGETLATLLAALYAHYGYMGTRLLNRGIAGADPLAEMRRLMKRQRARPPQTLAGAPLIACTDYLTSVKGLPPSDVLSYRGAHGKAIVRPSGTEPKVKVYLSVPTQMLAEAEQTLNAMEADARSWLA